VIAYNTDVVRPRFRDRSSQQLYRRQQVHGRDLRADRSATLQALFDQYAASRTPSGPLAMRGQSVPVQPAWRQRLGHAQLVETQNAQVSTGYKATRPDRCAKVQLSFTRLTSPINGVVGISRSTLATYQPSNTNGLVWTLDRFADFTLPENRLPQIHNSRNTKAALLSLTTGNTIRLGGGQARVQYRSADQRLDQLKGELRNKQTSLWPGELVNARCC